MVSLTKLNIDATIGQLPTYNYQVSYTTSGLVVAEKFRQQPDLPGVIINDEIETIGMISRQKFQEQMSVSDRASFYKKRAIVELLNTLRIPPLIISDDCKITEAAQAVLNRSQSLVYEPIIVLSSDQVCGMLDCHTLLLAQSHILAKIQVDFGEKVQENEKNLQLLKSAEEKMKIYEQKLASNPQKKQASITNKEQSTKSQNLLLRQSQTLAHENQKLLRIFRLVYDEFSKAFQTISTNSNTINSHAGEVMNTSKLFDVELETIDRHSTNIVKITQQVRHLVMQASIIGNQSSLPSSNLTQINSEINRELSRLVQQSIESGSQINKVISSMKIRVTKIMYLATENTQISQGLLQKVARASLALSELQETIPTQDSNSSVLIPDKNNQPPL